MKSALPTIMWLQEIKSHFDNDKSFFNGERMSAIDDAISMLEYCEEEYQRGYSEGSINKAKEYEAEMKKLIDEKNRLKERLNLIYGTAGFKAAQVYDGRLNRLEESVNDLRSKVNTMSWDRCYICAGRKQDKQSLKDLINEYYDIKPLDREDFLNLKTIMDSRYVGHKAVHKDLNERIDELEKRIDIAVYNEIDDLKYRVDKLEEK